MLSGIYCIENTINGKRYVGKGVDVKKRMNQQHKGCKLIFSAISFYGKENFNRTILEYCEKERMNDREKYWIKALCSHVSENGYNLSWGGDDFRLGSTVAEEVKQKISNKLMGHPVAPDTKNKISASRIGMKFTDRHRENLSKAKKGKTGHTPSLETRQKMSESQSGEKHPNYGKKFKNKSSDYFGVCKTIIKNKYIYWIAQITIDKKCHRIGFYKTEDEAANAYNDYVIHNSINRPLNLLGELHG